MMARFSGDDRSRIATNFFEPLRYTEATLQAGGMRLTGYVWSVILLRFAVDFLLILGTNRLCGTMPQLLSAAFAAMLGGIYAGVCLLPGFAFLSKGYWYMIILGLVCLFAFGWEGNALRRWALFVLLHMALNGIAVWMGSGGAVSVLASVAGLAVICLLGFRGNGAVRQLLPLRLSYGENTVQLTALRDTGNTLRDPVTGQDVLVIGAEAAQKLTGLTPAQLKSPVETVAAAVIPGLRLIPYNTIGQAGGLLLALRFHKVVLDGETISTLVAFAPAGLDGSSEYQALTGGRCA